MIPNVNKVGYKLGLNGNLATKLNICFCNSPTLLFVACGSAHEVWMRGRLVFHRCFPSRSV
eukprot:6214895-Amphidinium_carterae.1